MPWPFVGGLYDKPKTLDELADRVQQNFDRLAQSLPNTDLSGAATLSSGLRVVAGFVASDGTATGTGFSSAKNATGDYTLTFASGVFSSTPNVVAMVGGTAGPYVAKQKNSSSPSATSFDVVTFDTTTATLTDTGWFFIAAGAR